MDEVNVAVDELAEAGRALGHLSYELGREVSEAASQVDSIAGTWRGHAADVFVAGWAEVDTAARRVVDTLADIARNLEVAAASYGQQDESSSTSLLALS